MHRGMLHWGILGLLALAGCSSSELKSCPAGYDGDGVTCTDVDECAAGTDDCSANATCTNTDGSFTCACKFGYEGNGVTCTDVDECAAGTDDCSANATCTNTDGSFTCACKSGYDGDGVTCTDIDECAAATSPCLGTSSCVNTDGSFECTCTSGYEYDGADCVDIDECAAYAPVDFVRPDGQPAVVDVLTDRVRLARGSTGSLYNAALETAAAPGGCSTTSPADTEWARGSCVGNAGPFTTFPQMSGCSPQSILGRIVCLHLVTDDQYYDVEFTSYTGGGPGGGFAYTRKLVVGGACGGVASCTNSDGSYTCDSCLDGFELNTDPNPTCVDIDECADGSAGCDTNASCTNTIGAYACACNSGYYGPGNSCSDIDECSQVLDDCDVVNGACTNTDGGFTCDCVPPAVLDTDGKTCLATCEPACGANEHCVADGTSTACACDEGYVPDAVNGGCVLADRCTDTTTVTFRKPAFTSGFADCVVPDVCITRGINRPLFNAAIEPGPWAGGPSPVGTLWYADICANSAATPSGFGTFQDLGSSQSNVGVPLCLYLPEHGLFYDVTITEWGSGGGGGFAYVRTAYQADGCGVSLDQSSTPSATCSETDGCTCPDGWSVDPASGKCRMPDPCATSGCDPSATCGRTGFETYRCECDGVDFTKPDYGDAEDCIRPDVCITRGDEKPIYNAAQEDGPTGYGCDITSPAGTLWALLPCADAADTDFSNFIDAAGCWPTMMVGQPACVKLLANGSYPEETWDILFTTWTSGGMGGGFAYHRWKAVGDGEVCQ